MAHLRHGERVPGLPLSAQERTWDRLDSGDLV